MRKRSEAQAPGSSPAANPAAVPEAWQAPPPPPPPEWKGDPSGFHMRPDMDQLVESFFGHAAGGEYKVIEAGLTLGEERSDYGTVLDALDRAEDHARRAHRLYADAKVEVRRYELDSERVLATMRNKAYAQLQEEKDRKERSKAISEGDLAMRMHELFPDEYEHVQLKLEKAKRAAEHLERFADLCKERCRSLNTMLLVMRK